MRVAIGRKRGILISILLHILLLTYLLYFIKTYYYSGLADSANRPAARVSMFSPSTKPASTQPDSAAPDIDTAQESPVSTAQPPDEPYEQPPTTLIMPQETTSPVVENIVPTQKKSRRLSASSWYKTEQTTQAPSALPQKPIRKENPLLSQVTAAIHRQQKLQESRPDIGELQTYALEFEGYQRKIVQAFKKAAAFFERTHVSERTRHTTIKGFLVINDDGAIIEVRLSSSSGDNQVDTFLKEFFASPSFPPLPAHLKGKPLLYPFTVECSTKAGLGTMRINVQG